MQEQHRGPRAGDGQPSQSRLKRALAAGGIGVGVNLTFPDPAMAEFLGNMGFDCVIVDAQHGPIADKEVQAIAMAGDLAGCSSMLRITADPPLLERYMALGLTGIQIPQVQSASEVRRVVEAVKYTPAGRRGLGNSRAGHYGRSNGGFAALMEAANRRTMIVVQVEDGQGIAALPEIVRIGEVDAVIVGQVDLTNDLGIPGEVDHPAAVSAVNEIIRIAGAAGKPVGLSAGTAAEADAAVARGARYLVTSVSRCLALSATNLLDAADEIRTRAAVPEHRTSDREV